MPVMIETERLQLQDAQKAQKNQILLGPGFPFQHLCEVWSLEIYLHKCKLQVWPNLEGLPLAHLRSNSFNLLLYLPKFNLGGVTLELPLVLSLLFITQCVMGIMHNEEGSGNPCFCIPPTVKSYLQICHLCLRNNGSEVDIKSN